VPLDKSTDSAWSGFRKSGGRGQSHDTGWLIDGWGDLLLSFNVDARELDVPEAGGLPTLKELILSTESGGLWKVDDNATWFDQTELTRRLEFFFRNLQRRLTDVTEITDILNDHFLVTRTELAFTPFAGDAALHSLVSPDPGNGEASKKKFHWSFQFRVKSDRAAGLYNRDLRASIAKNRSKHALDGSLRLVKQTGGLDYRLSIVSNTSGEEKVFDLVYGARGIVVGKYRDLAIRLRMLYELNGKSFSKMLGDTHQRYADSSIEES